MFVSLLFMRIIEKLFLVIKGGYWYAWGLSFMGMLFNIIMF